MSFLPRLRDPQSELLLLRSCMEVAKLLFGLRTCQPMYVGEAVSIFDKGLQGAIEDIVVCGGPFFGDFQWRLASSRPGFEGGEIVTQSDFGEADSRRHYYAGSLLPSTERRRRRRRPSASHLAPLTLAGGSQSSNLAVGSKLYKAGTTPSQTGKFSIFDCFDGGSGTLICGVKESVKLYTNNIRAAHVELARNKAVESSLADALSQGIASKAASKQAQKAGDKAAKVANKNANRILGPIVSSGWDLFEVIYHEGYVTEGVLRGAGTLFGTYVVGFLGEERFGKIGYLIGSTLGSWIGGKIGLLAYDVASGISFLLHLGRM
ncbi:hypothetical protein R6Q57_020209 [Mikania cordata]